MVDDVPSPIDLRHPVDARAWEASANQKRPWRLEFFRRIVEEIRPLGSSPRVLELASGPGFLAEQLLQAVPTIELVALDFSAAMHELAARRLGALASRVQFIERNMRSEQWPTGLGQFDAVVTNQAVHELRHKRHAQGLHSQVLAVLEPNGPYLVCDHFLGEGGMQNADLYMTVDEQRDALIKAGFGAVKLLLRKGGLVLHEAGA
jgi:ubiquinone/menaquinone biosynthesis C-methylase UbiE